MVQLRKARSEDFPEVLILLRQLWPTKPIVEGHLFEVFLRVIAAGNRHYFCAVTGNRIVGLGLVTIKDNLWQEGSVAYVEELVVREDLRGNGIGTQLLERLILSAREAGCRRVELDSAFHARRRTGFTSGMVLRAARTYSPKCSEAQIQVDIHCTAM